MQSLDTALDALAEVLVTGAFHRLPQATQAIESALHRNEADLLRDHDQLRKKTSRNAAYLAAALAGLRAGQARICDVQQAGSGLRTYGRKGETALIAPASSPARRA